VSRKGLAREAREATAKIGRLIVNIGSLGQTSKMPAGPKVNELNLHPPRVRGDDSLGLPRFVTPAERAE
jgi:hypothetical protein